MDKDEKIGVVFGFLRLGEVRWGRAAMRRFWGKLSVFEDIRGINGGGGVG